MARFDRREFLKGAAAGAAAAAVGGCSSSWMVEEAAARPPRSKAPVSSLAQIKGKGVEKDLDKAVHQLLAPLGGMKAFVKNGRP